MGYFEGLIASTIKKDNAGRNIFCPWGILGRSYVIPTEERAAEIVRFLRWFNPICLVLVILSGSIFGWKYSLFGVAPLGAAILLLKFRRWRSDMDVCERSLQPNAWERLGFSAKAFGQPVLWLLICGSGILLGLSSFAYLRGRELSALAACLVFSIMFMFLLCVAVSVSRNR